MLKKAKAEMKGGAKGEELDLSDALRESSHQIWLAGVGAFGRAQQEGTKLFESLVQQGEKLERKTREVASETAAAARDVAAAKAKEMQQMAGGTWDKLEKVFDERVARALAKLGVYTQNDVRKLADRVDTLSAAVNELLKATGTKAPAVVARKKRTPAKKAAAPKAKSKR